MFALFLLMGVGYIGWVGWCLLRRLLEVCLGICVGFVLCLFWITFGLIGCIVLLLFFFWCVVDYYY